MKYHTYILKSETNGKYYIGHTDDLEARILQHNNGGSKSTKGRGPWKLFYCVEFCSRSEAMALERKKNHLKTGRDLRGGLKWIAYPDSDVGMVVALKRHHPDKTKPSLCLADAAFKY